MASRVRALWGVRLAGVLACIAVAAPAGAHAAPDDGARAAFVLLLGKYVTWPATAFSSAAAPIVVAVIGNAELAAEMSKLALGQRFDGRAIAVREIADAAAGADAHIVFASDPAQAHALASARPLRVIEGTGRLENTDIEIQLRSGRVAFAVNRKDVTRRGLKLSSKLLRLASSFE
jgi:hypothetical protein